MQFRILGPLEVTDDARAVALGGRKQRALLAALLLEPNRPVSVDRLTDVLWGERPPTSAANALQYHVSQLRRVMGGAIVTREPGYLLRVAEEELDALLFERLIAAGQHTEALSLWRGEPLTELADDLVAQTEARRLVALRLTALEAQIEGDLAAGRHAQLVPELESLVRMHPLRERLSAALMHALYGSGRQADALQVYQTTRQTFIDEIGIEPSPTLRELERAILRQDPDLAPKLTDSTLAAILVLGDSEGQLGDLLTIAEPLAARPRRELILVSFAKNPGVATAALTAQRQALTSRGVVCRVAAYTTEEAGAESALLASEHSVDLVLGMAASEPALSAMLEHAESDVGLLAGSGGTADGPIVTPFGGAEHDWPAIELAASLASSIGTSLRLLGTQAAPEHGRRDASRLLARASLLVQQVVGIVTEPVLIRPGAASIVEASTGARLLVIGLSERWRDEGIGPVRTSIAEAAHAPVLFVRGGIRPSGLAPSQTFTQFAWTAGTTTK